MRLVSRLRTLSRMSIGVAAGLLILLGASTASRASDDSRLCNDAATPPPDAIRACTMRLDGGLDAGDVPDVYLNRGNAHARMGDWTSALYDYGEAINRRPDFQNAFKNRGLIRLRAGNVEGALADFGTGLKLSKNAPEFYVLRGRLLNSINDFNAAIADFDKALAVDPHLVSAYRDRAVALLHVRQKAKALADYGAAIRLAPRDPLGYMGRATVHMDNADFASAIRDLDKAKALDPSNAAASSFRGEAKRLKGDIAGALIDHAEAIRLAPDDETVYINRSLAERDQRDYDKALADLDDAVLRNPKSDLAYADRGEIWMLRGDYDRALADLEKAKSLNPKSPVAMTLLGDTLRYKGELDRALEAYNDANHVVSDYVAAITGRGLVFAKKGDLANARAEFERALTLPSDSDAEKAKPAQALARDGLDQIRRETAILAAAKAEDLKAQDQKSKADIIARSHAEEASNTAEVKARDAEAKARDAEAKLRLAEAQQAEAQTGAMKAEARAKALEATAKARDAEAQERITEAEKRATQLEAQIAAATPAPIPDQGRRVALVIGNSSYRSVPLLPNPRKDAAAMAESLRAAGFDAVTLIEDATLQQMKKALRDFQDVADGAEWALVYYAGHGIEIAGQNYLIPVDARLQSDRDADDESVSLRYVLDRIQYAHALHMVILDACRENPFVNTMRRQMASRSVVARGLAPYEPKIANEIVVYAAKDGEQAADGEVTGHSPFTKALMARMATPRVEINKMFRLVTSDVLSATNNRQQPFVYGSTPGENDFYFRTK